MPNLFLSYTIGEVVAKYKLTCQWEQVSDVCLSLEVAYGKKFPITLTGVDIPVLRVLAAAKVQERVYVEILNEICLYGAVNLSCIYE